MWLGVGLGQAESWKVSSFLMGKKPVLFDDRCVSVWVLVAQSRLTLCGPGDYSSPGFSVHGILQAIILEWVAMEGMFDLVGRSQWCASPKLVIRNGKKNYSIQTNTGFSIEENEVN